MDKNIIKMLTVLFKNGYTTEKAIASIGLKELVAMKCFNETNVKILLGLQEAIKTNTIIPFLSSGTEQEPSAQA